MATDPVCGMKVDDRYAESSEHQGEKYFFCSSECKQKFDRNPEQYLKSTAA